MNLILKAIIVSLILPGMAWASLGDMPVDARSRSLGDAFVGMPLGPWAVFQNPAGLGQLRELEVGADYRKPYFVADLNDFSLSLVRPAWAGAVGLGLRRKALGSLYAEDNLVIGYGYSLILADVGANLHLLSVASPGYEGSDYAGRQTKASVDYGILLRPFSFSSVTALIPLTLGYSHFGMFEPQVTLLTRGAGERIKAHRRLGVAYTWPADVNWIVDLVSRDGKFKDLGDNIHGGIEVWFDQAYAVRVGLEQGRLAGGVGIAARSLSFDVALSSHRELGSSLGISATWRPGGE